LASSISPNSQSKFSSLLGPFSDFSDTETFFVDSGICGCISHQGQSTFLSILIEKGMLMPGLTEGEQQEKIRFMEAEKPFHTSTAFCSTKSVSKGGEGYRILFLE
jgi:hypothetical protein